MIWDMASKKILGAFASERALTRCCLRPHGRRPLRVQRPAVPLPLGEVERGEAEAAADAVARVRVEEQGHALSAKVAVAVSEACVQGGKRRSYCCGGKNCSFVVLKSTSIR